MHFLMHATAQQRCGGLVEGSNLPKKRPFVSGLEVSGKREVEAFSAKSVS
jgi:hypothetical protein